MNRNAWIAALGFAALALASLQVFAQTTYSFKMPEANEPIYGTWVNTKYTGAGPSREQKLVYTNWGYRGSYYLAADKDFAYEWTFVLLDKRTDGKGDVWYKEFDQASWGKGNRLVKISNNGTVLEIVEVAGFPKESELNSKNPSYRIYYRQ